MKMFIDADEWYPVFSLYEGELGSTDPVMELTESELADYNRVMHEFACWQERLEDANRTYRTAHRVIDELSAHLNRSEYTFGR